MYSASLRKKRYIFWIGILFVILFTAAISGACASERKTYRLLYLSGGNGTIQGESEQTVAQGESGTSVTAVPDEGYEFLRWSDDVTTPARQDENIAKDATMTAYFTKEICALRYAAGIGGAVTGDVAQAVVYGESGTSVTAVPDEGYEFLRWSDDVPTATRTESNVCADISVTAEFGALFAGGTGSTSDPYRIETYAQLLHMRSYPDKYYRLQSDLDLHAVRHEPIFDTDVAFCGYFDGGGYAIKKMNVRSLQSDPSLFGVVDDGIILNLRIEDARVVTPKTDMGVAHTMYRVGIVAGAFDGYIDGVDVSGTITVDTPGYKAFAVGGLAGAARGHCSDCTAQVRIQAKQLSRQSAIGGLMGEGESVKTDNCTVSGEIEATGADTAAEAVYVGGLIGWYGTSLAQGNGRITDSAANMQIKGGDGKVGGCIGRLDVKGDTNVHIDALSAQGKISGKDAGGFLCESYATGVLLAENSYTSCEVAGTRRSGAFAVYVKNTQIANCYSVCGRAAFVYAMEDSTISCAYYAGDTDGYIVHTICNSRIENMHVLRTTAENTFIGSDTGVQPSQVDITAYKTASGMYAIADVLNAEQSAHVWANRTDDFPVLDTANAEEVYATYAYERLNREECAVYITNKKDATVAEIPSKAIIDGIEYTVTQIASSGFASSPNLVKVKLPNTVKKINSMAFVNCGKLQYVDLKVVEEIGSSSFYKCGSLDIIVIPKTVHTVGANVFRHNTTQVEVRAKESDCTGWNSIWNAYNNNQDVHYESKY